MLQWGFYIHCVRIHSIRQYTAEQDNNKKTKKRQICIIQELNVVVFFSIMCIWRIVFVDLQANDKE